MTYGCKNHAPYQPTTQVQDGMLNSWAKRMVEVPFVMAKDCQYTLTSLGKKDKKCKGCSWRKK